ncbi:uncharacterized protein LOC123267166 [Cotesia glomerata]|nr:uncharacterized protein LOC123267166 [Cotesia glomerata]
MVKSCLRMDKYSNIFDDCIHDKNSNPYLSVRKLSLERANCNESNYHVMTSARFYEKDGIIGIEAQCGLLVDGRINPQSVKWNTRNRDYFTRDNPPEHVVLNSQLRTFLIDDFVLPDGEFVTAVKLDPYHPEHYISFVVEGRNLYDLKKNSLYKVKRPETNVHRPDQYLQAARKEIKLYQLPEVFTQTSKTYEMSESSKHLVKIANSHLLKKTEISPLVPFIDMNVYNPSRPLPLGGLGLMYKSVPGHAGFLTFKFISTKFTSYISPSYAEDFNIPGPKLHY